VLVAATGGGVGMPEAGHQLALCGAGPSGEGASRVAKVVEVQFVVSQLVASPAPVLVKGRGRDFPLQVHLGLAGDSAPLSR
jgi:hypothetical protein